jgi:hypothetical protein
MAIVLETPKQIAGAVMLIQRKALGLEIKGMKLSRGRTAYAVIKDTYGFKGSKESVYKQFTDHIKDLYPGVIKD